MAMNVFDAYIFDLDGTVYLGGILLPNAGETIQELRKRGKRTVFLSNNPTHTRSDYTQRLAKLGLPTEPTDIISSSVVMVDFLKAKFAGQSPRLFVVGEPPLKQELSEAGFVLTERASATDVVIASFDRTFVYQKLQIAFDAIRRGARFFATNGDKYCPVPGGGEPDAACIIAAIEACTDKKVEAIVGKPSQHMARAVLNILQLPPERGLMVGDRLETDVKMGLDAGMSAALTLTGATTEVMLAQSTIRPHYVLKNLGDLLEIKN